MENQTPPITEETTPPPIQQPTPEETLYAWSAPGRIFKHRSREFYTTVGALVLLLSVILFFAKEFLLIGVILAMGFVSYVLASVPPETVTHTLTNKGIRTNDKLYPWTELGRYWWGEKWHQQYVTIETPGKIPSILILVKGEGEKDTVDKILKTYLINEKPQPTWFDKAAKWLQDKVPLESD